MVTNKKIPRIIYKINLSQTSLVIIGDAITFGSNFLSIMVLARLLPIETMGTYRELTYLGTLFVTLFEFGLTNSIYRFWNIFNKDEKSTFSKMLVLGLAIFGIIAALGLVGLSDKLSLWYKNPDLGRFIRLVALYPFTSIIVMLVRPILISDGHSILATGIETIFSVLSFLALSIPVYFGNSFEDSLRIWMLVLLVRTLFVPIILRPYLFTNQKITDKVIGKKVISYTWPIQLSRLPGIIMNYFDKIYMSFLLNPAQFAIYGLGAREIPFIGTIGYSVSNVLIPKLVRDFESGDINSLLTKWKAACKKTALITYWPTMFCLIFADLVIKFLYSATYSESTNIFRIFTCITFLRVIEYASLAKSIGESKLILKTSVVGLGVILVLSYPLSRLLGGIGMALVIFISTVVSCIYFLVWYAHHFKKKLDQFFPIKDLLKYLGYSLLSTGIIKLLSLFFGMETPSRIPQLFFQISLLALSSFIIYCSLIYFDNRLFHQGIGLKNMVRWNA